MRILIFDWLGQGHHEKYLQRFATALSARADVAVAAPSSVLTTIEGPIDARPIDLGDPRPDGKRLATDRRELDLLERTVREARADHAVHVFADGLLPALAAQPRGTVPLSLLLFRPRAHYPDLGSPLTPRERAAGFAYERLLARFRRRRDANAVLTLDPVAAGRWGRRSGAPVHWLPEPWVEAGEAFSGERRGCVLYGYLSSRKGIDRLARAVEFAEPGIRVVLAGVAAPGFEDELEQHCETMRAAGAQVERIGEIDEREAQRVLGSARVAVLPYRRHIGMSRVLLESAAAGTPVLTDEFGLLGHLVRTHELGAAFDTDDREHFALALAGGVPLPAEEHMRRSAEELGGRERFSQVLGDAFGLR